MALTDTRIRNTKAAHKPFKMADGGSLYIEIRPNGTKLWRFRYRIANRENVFAMGSYPEVSLAEAREQRDAAKRLVKRGIHPAHHRKLERVRQANEHANTFEAVAREWLARNAEHWTQRTQRQRQRALEADVFPVIGSLPVRQVTPAHVLALLRSVETRAPTMATLVNLSIGGICRYAVATLRAETDPTAPLRGSLRTRTTKHSEPLPREEIPAFLQALHGCKGHFSNKAALQLLLLTLTRTVEVLGARWEEFDLEAGLWRIPSERMKMREAHSVPLPRQAIELLTRLQVATATSPYLFPHRSNLCKHVSRGVLWKAVASMGYLGRFSPHGIRATGSTILHEMGYRPDLIERQLAHQERSKTRASYNRAEYLSERHEMMQTWANYLDSLSTPDIVPKTISEAKR